VAAGPGVSRTHCRLLRDADGAWLEDQSTYGTFLNGERVGGRVALRAGDRLRLGNPGLELELVRVEEGDGAP
jgi:pSer/pThr/pTyr-binding forkhead associated (FHA) protein